MYGLSWIWGSIWFWFYFGLLRFAGKHIESFDCTTFGFSEFNTQRLLSTPDDALLGYFDMVFLFNFNSDICGPNGCGSLSSRSTISVSLGVRTSGSPGR
ncbi:hypothetical protein BD779DRAFT_1524842 [Infundibulicybe gibba]|nr:hypothetical protein BD779DRAFT_1524842 [Infundibulicybe gibba]